MFLKTCSIPAFIIRHQQDDAAIGSQSEEDLYIRTIELLGNGNQILFKNSLSPITKSLCDQLISFSSIMVGREDVGMVICL